MTQRTKKFLWGAGGTFIALFPAMLLGHVEGPDVRHTAAPGDKPLACADADMCHTANPRVGGPINAAGGAVTATFSSGSSYIPGGQPITITVTVSDPSPSWSKYFGFQMTARLESDQVNGQAGHFTATQPNTAVFCDTTDNFAPARGCGNYPSGHPAAGKPVVEFIEHAFPSKQSSAQTTPYTFTWTPPATDVGPIHFYVAGNAVNNDHDASGADHIYTASYILTAGVALPPPSVATGGVVNAASFAKTSDGLGSPVAPGSLVSVFGSNLGASAAEASSVPFPQTLGGVSFKINDIPAPIKSIAPVGPFGDVNTFANIQVPFGVAPGPATIVATVNNVDSPPETTTIVASAPGIFTIPPTGQDYGILVFADSTSPHACGCRIAAPTSASAVVGYPTGPIPRGTGAFFYAAGLGAMTPPVPDGSGVTDPNNPSVVKLKPLAWIGDGTVQKQVTVAFAGQAPGFPGVYQINITVPSDAPVGDNLLLWLTTPDGSVTSNKAKIAVK